MNDHYRELWTQTYGKILGGHPPPPHFFFLHILKNIDVLDKLIQKAFRIHKTLK